MSKFTSNAQSLLQTIQAEIERTGRTDLAAQIQQGKKRAVQTTEVFRKNANGSPSDLNGYIRLVEPSDDVKKGAISLDKGKLLPGTIMAITKFSLEYGVDASITDSARIAFSNLIYSDVATKAERIPLKLRNANFKLFHGNNLVVKGVVSDYLKPHDIDVAEGLGSENSSTYRNISPIYIADDQGAFQLELELPQTGTMPSSIHHIGFKLDGLVLTDR